MDQNIQIKIALSVDKVRILIKILAESSISMAAWPSIWEIKSPSLTRTLGRRHSFLQNTRVTVLKMIIAGNSCCLTYGTT